MQFSKCVLVFVFIFSSSFVFTQGLSSIDLALVSGSSYRSLSNQDGSERSTNTIQLRNDVNSRKANWSIGVNVNKRFSQNIFLKTGLRFSKLGYTVINSFVTVPTPLSVDLDPLLDPSQPFENFSTSIFREYLFLEIPLMMRFEKKFKDFSPYVELGVSTSYYLNSQTTMIIDRSEESFSNREEEINSINFFGNVSIGLNKQISDPFQVFVQANYSRQLNSFNEGPIGIRLNQTTMEIGLRFTFINQQEDK